MFCPHGNLDVNCPICLAARQVRPPLEITQELPPRIPSSSPDLKTKLEVKSLEDNLRSSGVTAFEHAPKPLTRDGTTSGILGGSIDMFSERIQKSHRELPQLDDVRENTRLKIPHKEIRRNL